MTDARIVTVNGDDANGLGEVFRECGRSRAAFRHTRPESCISPGSCAARWTINPRFLPELQFEFID
jgi:hypothetical protein